MDYKNIRGINFLRLRGTEAERARAHGVLLKEKIANGAIPFLAKKNELLIRRSPGIIQKKPAQASIIWFYNNVLIPYLQRKSSVESRAVLQALATESGISYEDYLKSLLQPDAFMLLCRTSVMKYLLGDLPVSALPACTSAVTLANWNASKRLLVCRNQDYPVVGPWEKNTTVLFNEPTEKNHVPFISITTAGLHSGGLTSMNREGLTLALHAHFGRNISLKGTPIVEIGNAIIREAKTLGEAVDIASRFKTYANWAFVISSAKENDAAVLEITPSKTRVRHAEDGFLAHTNFFHSPELHKEEALISGAYAEDLHGRLNGIYQSLKPNRGELEPRHMTSALGSQIDPQTGQERVIGNTVSVITTIKSAVFDPGAQKFWVSCRQESPTGLGDFLEINADTFWKNENYSEDLWPSLPGYHPKDSTLIEGVRSYRVAYQSYHMESDHPGYLLRTYESLQKAAKLYPADGNIWVQKAILAVKLHRFKEARQFLEKTLDLILTPHITNVRNLYIARCLDIEKDRQAALLLYSQWETVNDPSLRQAMFKGLKKPYRAKDTQSMMIDLQFPDTFHY